jgi:tetratricopeptide (TPR) repeat protein
MVDNYLAQNVRDFTIQILDSQNMIVGTGFVASDDGKIITCAHVVEAAIGPNKSQKDSEISIYFPQAKGDDNKLKKAKIISILGKNEDDIALLRLTERLPIGVNVAVLGDAESSFKHEFHSYGYRSLDAYSAGWAYGTILGSVEPPKNKKVHFEPIQLESSQINKGMSGAAILDIDEKSNLVVGIVSNTWFPDKSTKDRDTAWAANAKVLSIEPFNIPIRNEPHKYGTVKKTIIDIDPNKSHVETDLGISWNYPPPINDIWVGREEMIYSITEDWKNPIRRVTQIIGFAGEGKSSLVREWLTNLIQKKYDNAPIPDGIFWWGFSENQNVDLFFEAIIKYMSKGNVDPTYLPSSNIKAKYIGEMLKKGRYIFVLDGLEIMQFQGGNLHGSVKNEDLREFIRYLAAPYHESFCIITSGLNVSDLMDFVVTCSLRELKSLALHEGVTLLRKLGINGQNEMLQKVVKKWECHALTLTLIASYLIENYGGDINRINEVPFATSKESRYENIQQILETYDKNMTTSQAAFLTIFSAVRLPINESAFSRILTIKENINSLFQSLPIESLKNIILELIEKRVLRYNHEGDNYTIQPIIKDYYYSKLVQQKKYHLEVHEAIANYFFELSMHSSQEKSIDALSPLVEAVHHSCRADNFAVAWNIYMKYINPPEEYPLTDKFGAYNTALNIMREFYPNNDMSQTPMIENLKISSQILANSGFCLMTAGDLKEAVFLLLREIETAKSINYNSRISNAFQNLSRAYILLGELDKGTVAARKAIRASSMIHDNYKHHPMNKRRIENTRNSFSLLGWAYHLRGYIKAASSIFKKAEEFQLEICDENPYLEGYRGIFHADHLLKIGDSSTARTIIENNIQVSGKSKKLPQLARCYRLLGNLESDNDTKKALESYRLSVNLAREIFRKEPLIEVLTARGRFLARNGIDFALAFNDLNEALNYSLESNYKVFESDIRLGLAWANLAAKKKDNARLEANRSIQLSQEIGYYWGKVDAEQIIAKLNEV